MNKSSTPHFTIGPLTEMCREVYEDIGRCRTTWILIGTILHSLWTGNKLKTHYVRVHYLREGITMNPTDILAFSVYGACFILYHIVYLFITNRKPALTKKGRINKSTASWLNGILSEEQYLLAVHQIRNMILSITFLVSTGVILIGFLLTYGLTKTASFNSLPITNTTNYAGWLAFSTLSYSLLNLLLALRHFNNLTILIRSSNEQLEQIEGRPALDYLEKLFIAGSQRYMLGRRGFLYAIASLFWYVNLWIFIGLVLALTFTLSYHHDF